MTDLKKFLDLYASFGIILNAESCGDELLVTLEAGSHPLIGGYSGFVTTARFDKDGKFIKQGVWE